MKTLVREEALKLWEQWWNETKEEWFKIEVLQDYSGEDSGPSLTAWLAGDKEKSIKLMSEYGKKWIEMCQKSSAQKRRFRIVKEPYTPYTDWEIELYRRINVPLAGETVRLVSADKVKHLNMPDGDVTIFDQKKVARAYYTKEGRVRKIDFYDATEGINDFLELRWKLQTYAFPITF